MQGPRRWARACGCQSSNLLFLLTSNNHAMLINGTDTGMHTHSHTDACNHKQTHTNAPSGKCAQAVLIEEEIILFEWKLLGRLPKCSSEFNPRKRTKFCHSFKLDDTDWTWNDGLILGIGSWQVKLDTSNLNYDQKCLPKCSIMSGL